MTSINAGRSPLLNKYRLSRRGRKLQISDDQRTLLALPKDVPERIWAEILQKEENDLVCFDIREEILEEALRIGYERYMEKQNAYFTCHCAAKAWLKLIEWHFYRHDPGEDVTAYPPCHIPKREESWTPDELPAPSPKDTYGRAELVVLEDHMPDETLPSWHSSDSLDVPVIGEIPEEYWFPGKVKTFSEEELEPETAEEPSSPARGKKQRRKKSQDLEAISGETFSTSADLNDESEVLQKVTDYSTVESTPKASMTSVLKTTTPVDGSLHGAGDSTVGFDVLKTKRSTRKLDKIKNFSRPSMSGKSRGLLPVEMDSRSRISVISDCRLRNLRLDTHFEISSEKVDTPTGEPTKRK